MFETTAKIKIAQGYQVHVINFANMAHSDRYNPFDYIEKDINAETVANKIVESENKDSQKMCGLAPKGNCSKPLSCMFLTTAHQ